MNCQDVELQLEEYSAGEVEAPLGAQMQAHLEACPACSRSLADARRIENLLGRVRLPELPEGFFERQRSAVLSKLGAEIEWQAPKLSLLLFLAIIAGYVQWSIEPLMDSVASLTSNAGRFVASLDGLGLLYGLLLLMAVTVIRHDPVPEYAEVRR